MNYASWDKMLYTEEEFKVLYSITDGFNNDINGNCRIRSDDSNFDSFIDQGSEALLRDHPEFVASII